jgi:formylglycine-generating enzyme required for sulfatase activity
MFRAILLKFLLLAFVTSLPLIAGANSLHQAVRAKDLVTLESLLTTATDLNVDDTVKNGITPLHLAAASDFFPAAKLLIEHGADVNAKTSTGFTPLHWAASKNAVDSIQVLIDNGANIDAKALSGITPLHWAASKNATDAVKLLIAAGADINAHTKLGYTPLHMAIKNNPYSASAVLLAKAQADLEEQAGFLAVDELQDDEDSALQTNAQPQTVSSELPDKQPPRTARPGSFLDVPLGTGCDLEFVWVDTLKIWFGKYEISNIQYRHFDTKHSSRTFEGLNLDLADQPVVYVSWYDAESFCQWLNTNFSDRIPANYEFRLPTSGEWEFTASCSDERKFPWGDQWPPLYGNFSDMTARKNVSQWQGILGYDDGYIVTCLIQNSGMNECGIYGLAGNVWEWCDNWFDKKDQRFKIRKGGSWDFDPKESLRILANGLDRPEARYDTIGFRIIVAPKRTQQKQ